MKKDCDKKREYWLWVKEEVCGDKCDIDSGNFQKAAGPESGKRRNYVVADEYALVQSDLTTVFSPFYRHNGKTISYRFSSSHLKAFPSLDFS